MNRENLQKLADHLDTVKPEAFDMSWFAMDEHGDGLDLHQHDCGTAGCAVGYGPAAGFPVTQDDIGWIDYSERVFGLVGDSDVWEWCFSGMWWHQDNTPTGAARRIRHLLNHGLPHNALRQVHGNAPYIFAKEEA